MSGQRASGWLLGTTILVGVIACGPPADRVNPSHRLDLDPWQTLSIEEQGRELRVRVLARHPEDPAGIAACIVRQRRGQGWNTIHVEVQHQETGEVDVVSAHHPFPLDDLTSEDPPTDH